MGAGESFETISSGVMSGMKPGFHQLLEATMHTSVRGLVLAVMSALLLSLLIVTPGHAQEIPTRSFRLGFTPFAHDITPQAVQQMREFLAENADILAVHLDGVPWVEALADRPYHPKLIQEWADKAAALPPNAKVYLAISPLDNGRKGMSASRGANKGEPIPPELRGKSLDDPLVKKAYLHYCRQAIAYFKPDYLCIGIEVNELYHHSKSSWPGYVALHEYIYAQIKAEHPTLPVFASFSVHNMLNPAWKDRAEMLKAYKGLMHQNDMVAISFYPFMGGLSGQVDMALAWLDKEFGPYRKPFAVAEMGQLAEKLTVPSLFLSIDGNPQVQASFYEKMLAFAQSHQTAFVISFLYRDYDALWERIKATVPEAFIVWRDCGLLDEKGNKRPAYEVWHKSFRIPYREAPHESPSH
jgi:hypothetical protein